MLPIKDNIPSSRYPVVTVAIMAINVIVFLWELQMGWRLEGAFYELGIVPMRYTHPAVAEHFNLLEQLLPFLSSMFLHGGWVHLLGNMWTLWIFGDNVEDRLGHGRFVTLYLFGGVAAALLQILTNAHSALPTIGASGAVAGVMGAYFRFFPHARVTMIIPPFFLGPLLVVPAVLFLGWWFFLQFFNGALSLSSKADQFGGIAWWAHVGGFAFGVVAGRILGRRKFSPRCGAPIG